MPSLLGSFRPSSSRAPGAALWTLQCCLRARELDSLLSQQLLRATTFGYWLSPGGGSCVGGNAGRTGDHRPGRSPGYRQGRVGVLCAGTRSQGWVSAGSGGHDVLHDDPLTAGHGRPVDGSGCDPDCDGSNFGLLETTVLPVGGTRVWRVAGQRQGRQEPTWSAQNGPVRCCLVVQGRRTTDATAKLHPTRPDPPAS